MTYTIKLNEWWCDYGEFQALRLSCSHVIAACSSCYLRIDMFVDPVYKLENVYKAYELQFGSPGNKDYWSQYTSPKFVPDPKMF